MHVCAEADERGDHLAHCIWSVNFHILIQMSNVIKWLHVTLIQRIFGKGGGMCMDINQKHNNLKTATFNGSIAPSDTLLHAVSSTTATNLDLIKYICTVCRNKEICGKYDKKIRKKIDAIC